jgi:DNA-directed RNA polymerase specialized sigma24 family protein
MVDWLDDRVRDGMLLEAVGRGNAEAADLFFMAHGAALYGALLKLFPNPYDSSEALRRVVLCAIERAPAFPADGSASAHDWLMGIVAEVAGVGHERLTRLRGTGTAELRDLADTTPIDRPAATDTAEHIRPAGGGRGDGIIVSRGASAQVKQVPQVSLMQVAALALQRLNEAFAAWQEEDEMVATIDETGGIAGELPEPSLTPTITRQDDSLPVSDYEGRIPMPELTPSIRAHRSPQRTPSTETLRLLKRGL